MPSLTYYKYLSFNSESHILMHLMFFLHGSKKIYKACKFQPTCARHSGQRQHNKTLGHFYGRRWRPTDFSVFLLTSFRCDCHTPQKSYAEQLECTLITRAEFINSKTGLKKEVSDPRILGGCNRGGGVLNFFFLPCSFESSKLNADRCKGHCHIC